MKNLLFPIIFLFFLVQFGCAQTKQTSINLEYQKWAETPPYGWNSWDCYGPTVVESEVKANADYMSKNLKEFGWEYIIVDIRWYVDNDKAHGYNEKDPAFVMDEYGRFLPSQVRFPSAANGKGFKELADYVHAKGLKFGIHIMRGIPKVAVKQNTPVFGSDVTANQIYNEKHLCGWLGDMYTVDSKKEGSQAYYNSIFDLYAAWGIDYIKVDDLSAPYYHGDEIEMIRKAIDRTGRKIVLSTSPGETPIGTANHVKTHANMWRIVNDFWDTWPQLKLEFEVCDRWSPHVGNGHFPDADMLPLGRVGIRAENGDDRMTRFTKDEQITLMTLFSIFRSPLMFGGDLPSNDEFTLSLLTNNDVLDVNKYSENNHQLFRKNDLIAWTAGDPKTGDKYLALFNAQDQEFVIESKALWKSDKLSAKAVKKSENLTVDITGAKKLFLVVTDGGNGNAWDHADWIEPKIIGSKETLNLTSLTWKKATAGWGKVQTNKSVSNNSLSVDSTEYTDGIGTHSPSVIEYEIPEGYTQFSAKVGIDKEGAKHPDQASVQFMVFTQDPSGIKPAEKVKIPVTLSELGLSGEYTVTDLWSHTIVGTFADTFAPEINNHGAGLYRLSKAK